MYPIFNGEFNCKFYPIFQCCSQILFLQRRLALVYSMFALNFVILLKFSHFLSRLAAREVTCTFSL